MKMLFLIVACLSLSLVFAHAAPDLDQLAQKLGATTLLSYLKTAGLEILLRDGEKVLSELNSHVDSFSTSPFTVFAPTNAAFDALPPDVKSALTKDMNLLKQVLEFHITDGRRYSSQLSNDLMVSTEAEGLDVRVNIYGETVTIDGAQVTLTDQNATNDVIHVIDKVLYPLPTGRIPVIVAETSSLSTLLYAVTQGKLVEVLNGDGPLTVFAPNNNGFDKLPARKFSDLLSNTTALQDVLKYHVLPGTYFSKGLTTEKVTTLNGEQVSITVNSGLVMVNKANVIMADIPTANGVIHIIDNVLIPK